MESDDAPVWRQVLAGDHLLITTLFCFSVWLHAADSTLVATMIPRMIEQIGGTRLISWTVSLYEMGTIVSGAASSLLTIRFGLRRPMMAGALCFSVGCMISSVAPNMETVLAGRVFQGLGGGALIAISFVGAATLYPAKLVPGVLAVVSAVWGTSAFMGPLIGGLFVEFSSWRYGFALFAIKALMLVWWIRKSIPHNTATCNDGRSQRFPFWRLSLLSVGIITVSAAGLPRNPVMTVVLIVIGVLFLVCFLYLDGRRDKNRMLPLRAVSLVDPIGTGTTMIICFTIATIATTAYGPLLMVSLYKVNLLVAGYIAAGASVGWTLGALMFSGTAAVNDGRIIRLGMWLLLISVLALTVLFGRAPIWVIAILTLMQGSGFGMAWALILRLALAKATTDEAARIPSAMPTLQRSGYALGAAIAGVVANGAGLAIGAEPQTLQRVAFWVFASGIPFAVVGLLSCYRFTSGVSHR